MKELIYLTFLILMPYILIGQDCNIGIKVSGIEKKKGAIIIALFDNEDDYLKNPMEYLTIKVGNKDYIEACFSDIQEGVYSISVIHDLDENGKLNTSMFGPPTEPYGFLNNVKGFMGPPDFKDTSFKYQEGDRVRFEINLF